ncbi:hypothetical protein BY996DRAFT_6577451 [Phakopsora pachyrhizi]|nr:hypothetical protein BY996DRAFT_6577451 [Phakopsora pachyrhizi]
MNEFLNSDALAGSQRNSPNYLPQNPTKFSSAWLSTAADAASANATAPVAAVATTTATATAATTAATAATTTTSATAPTPALTIATLPCPSPLNMSSSWQSPMQTTSSSQSNLPPNRTSEEVNNQQLMQQLISQVITAVGLNAEADRLNSTHTVRRYDARTLPVDPRSGLRVPESLMAAIEQAYLYGNCGMTELKLYKDGLNNSGILPRKRPPGPSMSPIASAVGQYGQMQYLPPTPSTNSHIITPHSPTQAQRFLGQLTDFLSKSNRTGFQLPIPPAIDNQAVDLFKLYSAVQSLGGSQNVARMGAWTQIANIIELMPQNEQARRLSGSGGSGDPPRFKLSRISNNISSSNSLVRQQQKQQQLAFQQIQNAQAQSPQSQQQMHPLNPAQPSTPFSNPQTQSKWPNKGSFVSSPVNSIYNQPLMKQQNSTGGLLNSQNQVGWPGNHSNSYGTSPVTPFNQINTAAKGPSSQIYSNNQNSHLASAPPAPGTPMHQGSPVSGIMELSNSNSAMPVLSLTVANTGTNTVASTPAETWQAVAMGNEPQAKPLPSLQTQSNLSADHNFQQPIAFEDSSRRQSMTLGNGDGLPPQSAQPNNLELASPSGDLTNDLSSTDLNKIRAQGVATPSPNLDKLDSEARTASPNQTGPSCLSFSRHSHTGNLVSRAATPSNAATLARNASHIGHQATSPLKGKMASNAVKVEAAAGLTNGMVTLHKALSLPKPNGVVEYSPICRPVDSSGGWDLKEVEEIYHMSMSVRPRRSLEDLGKDENNASLGVLALPISMCEDLLEELLDLLEEVSFEAEDKNESGALNSSTWKPNTNQLELLVDSIEEPNGDSFYRMMTQAIDDEVKPDELNCSQDKLRPRLGQLDLIFSILNILHHFGMTEDNLLTIRSHLQNQERHPKGDRDSLKLGHELSLATQSRLRSLSLVPSHVDAALALISKVATVDSNRRSIQLAVSQTGSSLILDNLMNVIIKLLPITDEEIMLTFTEDEPRMRMIIDLIEIRSNLLEDEGWALKSGDDDNEIGFSLLSPIEESKTTNGESPVQSSENQTQLPSLKIDAQQNNQGASASNKNRDGNSKSAWSISTII